LEILSTGLNPADIASRLKRGEVFRTEVKQTLVEWSSIPSERKESMANEYYRYKLGNF
jgi:hypothetical protein